MINSITIYNQGSSGFPESLTIAYENRPVHITFLSKGGSIFKTVPCLHSVVVAGLVFFQSSETKESDSKMCLEKYIEALKGYLPKYVDAEMKKSISKMDLVRLYFRLNDISQAKSLLETMENRGDVRMLNFIIKHKFEVVQGQLEERFTQTPRIGRHNCGLIRDVELENVDSAMHEAFDEFVSICTMVDEHTRFIFACEVLEIFPSDFYFCIERPLGFTLPEYSIFFKIQMADILIRRGKPKIATLMLVQAARAVQQECDMVLKRNLVKLALELVADKEWDSYFRHIIGELEEDEIRVYGLPVSIQSTMGSPMFLNRAPSPIVVEFESCSEIFEFKVVRATLKDQFIDRIKISTPRCAPKVMGVYDVEERFHPACSRGNFSTLHLDHDVHFKKLVLEDGSEVCCDKKMYKACKAMDVELVDVKNEGTRKTLWFVFKDGKTCRFYAPKDVVVSKTDIGFCLLLSEETKQVEIAIEIQEDVYENRICILG